MPNRARGYIWRNNGYINAMEFSALRPSGAFLSTVLDMAKWEAALYDDRTLTTAGWSTAYSPRWLSARIPRDDDALSQ